MTPIADNLTVESLSSRNPVSALTDLALLKTFSALTTSSLTRGFSCPDNHRRLFNTESSPMFRSTYTIFLTTYQVGSLSRATRASMSCFPTWMSTLLTIRRADILWRCSSRDINSATDTLPISRAYSVRSASDISLVASSILPSWSITDLEPQKAITLSQCSVRLIVQRLFIRLSDGRSFNPLIATRTDPISLPLRQYIIRSSIAFVVMHASALSQHTKSISISISASLPAFSACSCLISAKMKPRSCVVSSLIVRGTAFSLATASL